MENHSITTKFSTRLRHVFAAAEEAAETFHHSVVDTDHLLFALRVYQGSIAAEVLKAAKIKSEPLRVAVQRNHQERTGKARTMSYTGQARRAIVRATWTAGQNRHHFVGTEHLLAALISQRDSQARKTLTRLNVDLNVIRHQLKLVMRGTSHFPDITETLHLRAAPAVTPQKTQTPLLDEFGLDLNARAGQQKTDPVIGRDTELERMIEILERRRKNNAVLVGEPGVGKTAIVEGLARKIVAGNVPTHLLDKRIVQLDLTAMLAGTSYRGDFEDRLRHLLAELEKVNNVILFIDEIHTIVGTGNVGGALDTANMLKSALARGEIRVIGATTPQEYKQHIEKDAALERRFQVISVAEVSSKEAEQILFGLKPLYEKFHGVRLTEAAIEAAVELSGRYVNERFLPDKAIDVLDEAMSRKKIAVTRNKSAQSGIQERVHVLTHETDQLVEEERYEEALQKRQRLARLRLRLKKEPAPEMRGTVTREDVAEVVARVTGIPLQQLLHTEGTQFVELPAILRRRIIGQEQAIAAVSDTLLRARAGLQDPQRPLGVFLFLGPSGVGKTELTKVLAEKVFQNKRALIRVDMSEFGEKFTVSRLLGAPPGYIGFGEGGRLTEAVRRNPYSVVLFDEIEKAHPDVLHLLLQIFEDGRLTDASGKEVSFKNTICIMTSNIGNRYAGQGEVIGFSGTGGKTEVPTSTGNDLELKRKLQEQLRPELLGRIDKVIAFKPLSEADLKKIFKLEFSKLAARLKQRGVSVTLDNSVMQRALEKRDRDSGARFIRAFLQEHLEPQLARHIVQKRGVKKAHLSWSLNALQIA
jgi:ATP-dependent Clp protease ATP-binding subunit ClpC